MTIENEKDTETQSDIDLEAATAEISSELFGQGDEGEINDTTEGEEAEASGEHDTDASEAPPQQATEEGGDQAAAAEESENSAEVQATGAPKTWTKEALEEWAAVPPRAQQEILKREEDFLNGITQYKQSADLGVRYNSVVEPYMPVLEQEGLDPVQMFQSFAANHYILARGTPEQKVELAAAMLDGYKIPLPELLNFMADRIGEEPADPKVQALEARLARFEQAMTSVNQTTTAQTTAVLAKEIETFASDPAHPYFDEVANDIQKLFETGLATTLKEAYEKAVYANPVTRQKEIDRLTAEARTSAITEEKTRKDKKARATADQVTLTPKNRDGTIPTGSIDDTLTETMAAIEARG